jgi:hypothetical protein
VKDWGPGGSDIIPCRNGVCWRCSARDDRVTILPYVLWSSLNVCFLKGVQFEEVKSKIIAGALLAEAVANMAISKYWEEKEMERSTIYLLISL